MDRVKHENFVRAIMEDTTSLLLTAVDADAFRKEALGRIRMGSEASTALDQEMSSCLLHLACKHDAVQCARLLLEGGGGAGGLAPPPVDARDQLTRTPLHVAAETHSARFINLLLSKNARVDPRVIDGQPLLPLEITLMGRRVQLQWSPDKSIEDLPAFLNERDLTAVRLLAEETRVVGELAYRYAMEGRVPALAMLLLVVEAKISGLVSLVIEGVRTKRSIYNSIVDEALSMGDAPARDGNERRKALLCEIQLLSQFGSASWRDQYDKRTLSPLLRAAEAGDMNVTAMLLMGNVDVNEVDSEGNTALHWCLSGISRTQEPRIVWLLLKNGARVFQGNKLGLTPVHSAAAKGNYKALQSLLLHEPDCVDLPSKTKETPLFFAVKNGSVECVKLLLLFGADTKARNLRNQRPIELVTSQDMHFILSPAKVVPCNHSSPQKHHVMSKESCKELMDDTFDGYDNDGFSEECYMGLNKSAYQRDFRSSNFAPQDPKGKSQPSPKQGSKGFPQHNHWPRHDYTRKIFVGGLPPSVDSEYLIGFFTAEFGHVDEAVVIGLQIGNRVQSRGFGFVKFESEKDVISAKEAHHVYMLGKRVEIKYAVARGFLPLEECRASSTRKYTQDFPKVKKSLLDGELIKEHGPQKWRPSPEKCLPSWFFIFRKWLPGFLRDETEQLGERYPLSSLKGNFRVTCRMELDHSALGYPKLSDFMRSLPGICRMYVAPVGSGPATHMVLLLEPVSFDHDELPESVSDNQSPRSPLNAEDSPHNANSQQGDACSETNVRSHQGDESSRTNAESQQDESSTGSLLDDYTVSSPKADLFESEPTGKSDLFVSVPARKDDLIESVPTRNSNLIESGHTRTSSVIESGPLPQRNECGPVLKLNLLESAPTRRLELIRFRPTTCFIDCPVERPPVPPRSCETDTSCPFFQSHWDKYLTPHPNSESCIICRSCEAAMQLVPCLHKICVACMMRCNVTACMTCGIAVSGVKSSPARCIDLLLSKNACVDLRVVEGQPLLPLQIALMSRRVQLQWSPDKSIEDILACLNDERGTCIVSQGIGTTVCAAVLIPDNQIFVGNIGDSGCVLSDNSQALASSKDHNPNHFRSCFDTKTIKKKCSKVLGKWSYMLIAFWVISLIPVVQSANVQGNNICPVKKVESFIFPRQFCPVGPPLGRHWDHAKRDKTSEWDLSRPPQSPKSGFKNIGLFLVLASCITPWPYIINMNDSIFFWKVKVVHVWSCNLISTVIHYLFLVIFDIMYYQETEVDKTLLSVVHKNLLICLIYILLLLILLYQQKAALQVILLHMKATYMWLIFAFCSICSIWLSVTFGTEVWETVALIAMVLMHVTKWLTAKEFKWIPFMLKFGGIVGLFILNDSRKDPFHSTVYNWGVICRSIELLICCMPLLVGWIKLKKMKSVRVIISEARNRLHGLTVKQWRLLRLG